MNLTKRCLKIVMFLIIIIQILPLSAFAANVTVEYRGFEENFKQFDKPYYFASGLPDKPFEITDGKHKVKDITPKFDDMNFRDYTFDGWNLKKVGGKIDRTRVYRTGDIIENITSDIQLIAIWKRKDADIIVSSMHGYLRGGNGDPNIIEGTAPKQSLVNVGDKIKLKQCPFSYDGYKFIGWLDSKSNLYEAGAEYTVESYNAIFTAAWVADATAVVKNSVTYLGGEGATGTAPNSFKLYNKNTFTIAENSFKKDGYKFLYWTDGKDNFNPDQTYQVKNNGDITLTAVWEKLPMDFNVTVTATSGGSTTINGTKTIRQGEAFEFTAVPDDGFIIGTIKVNGKETAHNNGLCRISSVMDNLEITVEFVKQKFRVSVEASSGGTVTPEGMQEVEKGATVSFEIKPNAGFIIDKVLIDDKEQKLEGGNLTLNNIDASHQISISFKAKPSVSANESEVEKNNKTGIIIAIVVVVVAIFVLVAMYLVNSSNHNRKYRKRRR